MLSKDLRARGHKANYGETENGNKKAPMYDDYQQLMEIKFLCQELTDRIDLTSDRRLLETSASDPSTSWILVLDID